MTTSRGVARFGDFLNAVAVSTTNVLEDVSECQMKEILTNCVNEHSDPDHAKPVREKLVHKLRLSLINATTSYVRSDCVEAFETFQVQDKLQLLLELKDKYKWRNSAAWRPPSEPHLHMRALRLAAKRDHLEKFKLIVSMKKHQVGNLKQDLKEKLSSSNSFQAAALIDQVRQDHTVIENSQAVFSQSIEKSNELLTNHNPLM